MRLVTVVGFFADHDGYGGGAQNIWRYLLGSGKALGVRRLDLGFGTDRFASAEQVCGEGLALAVAVPAHYHKMSGAEGLAGVTMHETNQLPAEYVEAINSCCKAAIVPSHWCSFVFGDSGVKVPIYVAPWGIDGDAWPYAERGLTATRPYRFLWSGTPGPRKGWDLAYRAFRAAFGDSGHVELMLHFRKMPAGATPEMFKDRNVTVRAGVLPRAEYRAMLDEADAFIYPSRGEGFGLQPREAAATGMPVAATNWGGLAQNIDRWATFPISVKETEPAAYHIWDEGQVGEWAKPDFDHLVFIYQSLFEYRRQALNNARLAAEWMHREGTWQAVGPAMRRAVEALCRPEVAE